MPLTCVPYCSVLHTALTYLVVLSRYWDCLVDPSLILLSVLIQGLSALSQYYKFNTHILWVFVTSLSLAHYRTPLVL